MIATLLIEHKDQEFNWTRVLKLRLSVQPEPVYSCVKIYITGLRTSEVFSNGSPLYVQLGFSYGTYCNVSLGMSEMAI